MRNRPQSILDANLLEKELETAASKNVASGIIASLRAIGLVDNRGKLTDLGLKWANTETYPEACEEIAVTFFPKATRDAILKSESTTKDIVNEYIKIEGMNEAGGRKNVRILSMLLKEASGVLRPEQDRSTAKSNAGGGSTARTLDNQKKRVPSSQKKPLHTTSGAEAQIEMTVPLEMLSDVMLALFSVASPDEVSVGVSFV